MVGRKSLNPQTSVLSDSESAPALWQIALTMDTDSPKVEGGSFISHWVPDHTDEAGMGLAFRQAHSQGAWVGGWF